MVRLNADELRGFYGEGEHDQKVSREAFRHIEIQLEISLRQGFTVVIDNTNLTVARRAPFLQIARKYNAETIAFLFDVPIETCLERNSKRLRQVPEEVIKDMAARMQHPTPAEFDSIFVIRD
jgi:predicted kinase